MKMYVNCTPSDRLPDYLRLFLGVEGIRLRQERSLAVRIPPDGQERRACCSQRPRFAGILRWCQKFTEKAAAATAQKELKA
jgi:hypothetical protein